MFGKTPTRADARRRVGFAPEIPSVPPFLSADEVIKLHARLAGIQPERIEDQCVQLLNQADLGSAPKHINAFSKGMLRRLVLAQALIWDPEFLVLDEPTADLDPLGRRDVRNQLLERKQRGMTTLLNSHLLSEVERVCDRVVILQKGKVLATGTMDQLVPEGQYLETVFVDLIEKARTA